MKVQPLFVSFFIVSKSIKNKKYWVIKFHSEVILDLTLYKLVDNN